MKHFAKSFCILLFLGLYQGSLISQIKIENKQNQIFKFIVIGHSYSVLNSTEKRGLLFDAINKEKPNYVFVLGDCEIYNKKIYTEYISELNNQVFFSPGNHDLSEDRSDQYMANVGYLNKTIIDSTCNFILFNSSESGDHVREYMDEALNEINPNNPTIILTHHRVWDDNLISEDPYSHEKSYMFSKILPIMANRVDYFFAGNSPRQYFGGQFCEDQKKNPNINYWCDIVGNMVCYSVGMNHNINFIVAELNQQKLSVYPRSIEIQPDAIIINVEKNSWLSSFKNQLKRLKSKLLWFGILFGMLLMFSINKIRK